MHYYATFCIAYAAGFSKEDALQIATSAQFVDDNAGDKYLGNENCLEFEDRRIYLTPTAHTLKRSAVSFSPYQEMHIWVPFHFLPGNEGGYLSEKWVATKNSKNAEQIVAYALSKGEESYGIQLLGVMAHCYADTFSHYGFAGVRSVYNRVDADSIDVKQYSEIFDWWESIKSFGVENAVTDLGHGVVGELPDIPYIDWEFRYDIERTPCTMSDDKRLCVRSNSKDYFEFCEKLYDAFLKFISSYPKQEYHPAIPFDDIKERMNEIIKTEENDPDKRGQLWEKAFNEGVFGESSDSFPEYLEETWEEEIKRADKEGASDRFLESDVYRFYQAAKSFRRYVIGDLLHSQVSP